jgi:hypothetical protein
MLTSDAPAKLTLDTLKLLEISKNPEKWKELLGIPDQCLASMKKMVKSKGFERELELERWGELTRNISDICLKTGLSILAIMTLLQFVIVPVKKKRKKK